MIYKMLKEVYLNANTQEIIRDEWVDDYRPGQEPNWAPCEKCGFKFDREEPKEIVAVFDETGKIIFREDAPPEQFSEEQRSFMVIENFEREIRVFIEEKMKKSFGEQWWKRRVPPDVKMNAENRQKKDKSRGFSEPLINCLNFSDYAKIILKRDNWKDLFAPIFGSQEKIKVWLDEIQEIRNSIMHSKRKITPEEKRTLDNNVGKIKKCIHASYKEG